MYAERLCRWVEVAQIIRHQSIYASSPSQMDYMLIASIPERRSPKRAKMDLHADLRQLLQQDINIFRRELRFRQVLGSLQYGLILQKQRFRQCEFKSLLKRQ